MNRVLLVEDSDEGQLMVKRSLANAGIDLVVATTFNDALKIVRSEGTQFDLVILDIFLPDGDGFKILEEMRSVGMGIEVPVFFLTSQTELESKVNAFNLGVDDYLVKPVNPIELRARVEMRLKKASKTHADQITRGDLVIDLAGYRVFRKTESGLSEISLTSKEFKILMFLCQNEGQVFARPQVVDAVWGKDVHILDRTVDSHIYGLRKKLGTSAQMIESIPQAGYRFTSPKTN